MPIPESWEARMELAALQGAVDSTPTLEPFIQETIDHARDDYEKTVADLESKASEPVEEPPAETDV